MRHMGFPYSVLFLCTGNSARSIMSEAILARVGRGKFRAYSAGSAPTGKVNPNAISLLERLGYDTSGFRSKHWSEFIEPGAPQFDFVFVICEEAAHEVFPPWPGKPITIFWNLPDPAAAGGSDANIARAFLDVYAQLAHHIALFTAVPIHRLDRTALSRKLERIPKGYVA
jgi:protein-tyrosine-phosphatase